MAPPPPPQTLREAVDELGTRLARIGAAASTLRSLAAEIRHGIPPATLLELTERLEKDLLLASQEVDAVHDRAARELESVRQRQA